MNPGHRSDKKTKKYTELARVFEGLEIGKREGAASEEPWTLAHALVDIEDSLDRIYSELIPKLLAEDTLVNEANQLLIEVTEELRHVYYHLNDSKYLRSMVTGAD